ncbi:MAG: DoxX family protein [Gemmatimonadales bacterium]|nr:MAG: DoxX family protein [Gemmatimonadales bacterium]
MRATRPRPTGADGGMRRAGRRWTCGQGRRNRQDFSIGGGPLPSDMSSTPEPLHPSEPAASATADSGPPGFIVLSTGPGILPLVLRLALGGVFLFEGARKFLYPHVHGIGRFDVMGFPFPGFFAPLVGGFEVACALLVLVGLGVRVAVIPLASILLAATVIILAQGLGWVALELALVVACGILLRTGGGAWSLDRRIWITR